MRCTATALLETLVPARGRRRQGGSQLRLASLASLFSYYSCRPAYGISLLHRASTAAFRMQPVHSSQPAALLQGRGLVSRQISM